MRSRDTSPETFAQQLAVYRRMAPAARVALAMDMTEEVRRVTAAGIRTRHPEYDDATVLAALRRVVLGDELFQAAWPQAPRAAP